MVGGLTGLHTRAMGGTGVMGKDLSVRCGTAPPTHCGGLESSRKSEEELHYRNHPPLSWSDLVSSTGQDILHSCMKPKNRQFSQNIFF